MTTIVSVSRYCGPATLLKVSGRVDSSNAEGFYDRAHTLAEYGRYDVVIDASGLEYISSAGLRSCILLAQECQQNGRRLILFGAPEVPREIFAISGIDRMIPVCADLPAAVAFLEG